MTAPPFRTARLIGERLSEDHLADLVALHLDPDVSRYLGGVRSPETTKDYLAANMAHWETHGFGLWVLRTPAGEFAGRAGLRQVVVDGREDIEIAYTFKRTLWGRGLASEIAPALTAYGLVQLALPSLVGLVEVENGASRRVLEKSNYTFERNTTWRGQRIVLYRSSSLS
ncbi:GNAT family N-acetyltransferase [Reyranella massiliensis]|uniref:GNAT family N-acetyltransferase n=1 Tax=Reyranella massiliensis TaxID=445220 RepID=UPI0003191790|nr:GNAT family N-acetyltransferase [Reyranella massiliensis]